MAGELISLHVQGGAAGEGRAVLEPGQDAVLAGQSGVPLVIGRREGYVLHDVGGKRLIDMHLNGGTYNLGHRNPEIIAAVTQAMAYFDIGNHHFPSVARTALARGPRRAPRLTGIAKVMFGSSGGEAIDLALKSARHATGRRRVVSVAQAYHGHTGLAVGTGDDRFARLFLADRPDEFTHVPFNDLDAMAQALATKRRRRGHHGNHSGHVRFPAARPRLPEGGQGAVRAARRALHRR